MKAAFTGGSLSFKGDKKKKKAKKKKSKAKHELEKKDEGAAAASAFAAVASPRDDDDGMTEAERKVYKRKQERELKDLEKQASKSHRERVEEFNEKLASLTELNDIPRVSTRNQTKGGTISYKAESSLFHFLTISMSPFIRNLNVTGQRCWKRIAKFCINCASVRESPVFPGQTCDCTESKHLGFPTADN